MKKKTNEQKDDIIDFPNIAPTTHEKAKYAFELETNLYEFVKEAWEFVDPDPYIEIQLTKIICDHNQALFEGRIPSNRLAESIPPGFGKSMYSCVMLPAWAWTRNPATRFLTGSYSLEFATRDSRRSRDLIKSDWYQYFWGHKFDFAGDQDKKTNYENTAKGYRFTFGTYSAFTGTRADFIIVDDSIKMQDGESKIVRDSTNYLIGNLDNRLTNQVNGKILLIGQRLHLEDSIGYVLSKKSANWEYLCLPLLCDPTRRCQTSIFTDNRKEGECLWKERFTPKIIARLKESMGTRAFNAQILQNPEAESGAIIKSKWLQYYNALPPFQYILMSLDTAFTKKKTSDYSAISVWGVAHDGYYLIDMIWDKLEYPDLRHKCLKLYNKYRPHKMIIEKASSGHALVPELKRKTRIPVEGFPTDGSKWSGSKEQRLHLVSPLFEAHKVFFPKNAEWLNDFEDELLLFPAVTHDDRVDSLSMALIYLSQQYATPTLRIIS
jgi:predicted phage terminase large subunit-like protein